MSAAPIQIWPALDRATEAALKASIERFGVIVPVVKDQHGRIIDGHHRVYLADKLGIAYETSVLEVGNDDEARELARSLNEDRRQLSAEQRRPVVEALRREGHSGRSIAGALGVGETTVRADLRQLRGTAQLPERITGLDGKSRPAAVRDATEVQVPASGRPREIANKAKLRVEKAVGTCNAFARGIDEIRAELAVAIAEPGEVRGWIEAMHEARLALARFEKRLREAQA